MRCCCLIGLVVAALAGSGSVIWGAEPQTRPAQLKAGTVTRTLEFGEKKRTYVVHVPPKYDPARPTALVINMHGLMATGSIQAVFSGMNPKADEAGFIVVYPNGWAMSFNAWAKPRNGVGPVDDVGFINAMLDDLCASANIDPKRIFATGMSNGGMMCYRLAAELSHRIAAIAPVGGTLLTTDARPQHPMPVMHFHGKADTIVPFDGPKNPAAGLFRLCGVDRALQFWIGFNQCAEAPREEELPDKANDGTRVKRKVWGPGKDGAEVVLYIIEGGGHTWPGQPNNLKMLGASTLDISANDLMWEFFCRNPMK